VLGVRDEDRARDLTHTIGRMLRTPGNPPFAPPGGQDGLLGKGAACCSSARRSSSTS
jgi:hypothetical protein